MLGRTLCTKMRGGGLYRMIHSSLSASTASVFNRLIRSCLKTFSAVLPWKTRCLVPMRQDCLRLQCGQHNSSNTQRSACSTLSSKCYEKKPLLQGRCRQQSLFSFTPPICWRGLALPFFESEKKKEGCEMPTPVLWKEEQFSVLL